MNKRKRYQEDLQPSWYLFSKRVIQLAAGEQNFHYYQVINIFIILLLLFLSSPKESCCAPLSYNGSIRYNEDQDGQSQQSNTQSLTYNQNQELSPVISLNESFRFSKSWAQGSGSRESYTPQVMLAANNYLFNLVMSASINEQRSDTSAGTIRKSWESFWSSRWDKPYLPTISLNLGQDVVEAGENPTTVENRSLRTGFGLDWGMQYSKLSCGYTHNNDFNKINQRNDIYDNYSLLFNSSKAFLQNKLNVSFSQKLNKQHRETTYKSGGNEDRIRTNPVTIEQTLYQNDSTPLNGTLSDQHTLMDGILDKSSINIVYGETINLGIKVSTQLVDRLDVYTLQDLSASSSSFTWDLYSSDDGTTWNIVKYAVNFIYTSNHFEIAIPSLQKAYLKVVSQQILGTAIDITELKAYQLIAIVSGIDPKFEYDYDNYVTNLGVNYNISQNASFSYNISYEIGRPSTGQNFTRRAHSANINMKNSSQLDSRINIGEFLQKFEKDSSTLSRNYGASLSYKPISTIYINVGVDRNES